MSTLRSVLLWDSALTCRLVNLPKRLWTLLQRRTGGRWIRSPPRSFSTLQGRTRFRISLVNYNRRSKQHSLSRLIFRLLLATRQTAALRKDETLEVTVINLLLRSYLSQNQYDQADRLIAKTQFQGQVNQAQSVRWLFYAGRLRAIQLNYSKAKDYFQTAIRRAPKDEVAPGFVQAVSWTMRS